MNVALGGRVWKLSVHRDFLRQWVQTSTDDDPFMGDK